MLNLCVEFDINLIEKPFGDALKKMKNQHIYHRVIYHVAIDDCLRRQNVMFAVRVFG